MTIFTTRILAIPETLALFGGGASTIAPTVDRLFFVLLGISVLIILALSIGLTYLLIRYRKGTAVDRTPPKYNHRRIEIAWTVGTLIVFLAIGTWGSAVYLRIATPPDGESVELYVVGRQWMWEVHHPGGRREHNQIHLPVGQSVRLNLISEDVIHSLYFPDFRLKHDVLPQRFTSLWLEASKPGKYDLFCAEFCGTEHHLMRGSVFAMQPQEYAEWTATGGNDDTLAKRGQELFRSYGCSACHAEESRVSAPSLNGLFGKRVALADGSFVTADEAYLHDSILLPNKQQVAGFEAIMPSYEGSIEREEVIAIIEYLKSRRDAAKEESQP